MLWLKCYSTLLHLLLYVAKEFHWTKQLIGLIRGMIISTSPSPIPNLQSMHHYFVKESTPGGWPAPLLPDVWILWNKSQSLKGLNVSPAFDTRFKTAGIILVLVIKADLLKGTSKNRKSTSLRCSCQLWWIFPRIVIVDLFSFFSGTHM